MPTEKKPDGRKNNGRPKLPPEERMVNIGSLYFPPDRVNVMGGKKEVRRILKDAFIEAFKQTVNDKT